MVNKGQPQFSVPQMYLSCQIIVEGDMKVCPMERFNFVIHDNQGKETGSEITPDPVWLDHPE